MGAGLAAGIPVSRAGSDRRGVAAAARKSHAADVPLASAITAKAARITAALNMPCMDRSV